MMKENREIFQNPIENAPIPMREREKSDQQSMLFLYSSLLLLKVYSTIATRN